MRDSCLAVHPVVQPYGQKNLTFLYIYTNIYRNLTLVNISLMGFGASLLRLLGLLYESRIILDRRPYDRVQKSESHDMKEIITSVRFWIYKVVCI